jgi:eukaryotic-like serine/threonine-protein kinase
MSEAFGQGQVINGRYRIVRKQGGGGMADVYLADDLTLGRQVAIKVLLPRYSTDAQFVERFRREAQAAAQLNHPNIVSVYDWGALGGTYYIVMEYVQGETLKDLIRRRGRLTPADAIGTAIGLLAALDNAHAAGIVHRDVKSQNILLDPAGTVKVADFGIARAGDSEMTEAGSILGTAQYLAPEQAKGEAVDARSDLYSVGVVLYEMLTGTVPFQGDSAVTVALKHVNEFPPEPADLVPGLPYALNQIVMKALAKDPAVRYQSAGEFARDLQSARSGGPLLAAAYDPALARTQVHTPIAAGGTAATQVTGPRAGGRGGEPPRKKKRKIWPWVLLGLFLLLIAVGAAFAYAALTGDTVKVPSVTDLSLADATAKLEDAGFKVKVHTDLYSDDVQKGFVIKQAPAAGTALAEGEVVDLWVSQGPETITLVDFTGMTADQVTAWLDANGLVGVPKQGPSDSVPKGTVYRQDPPATTTVKRGDTVTFWVSRGKPQVAVPDVTGQTLADARTAIENAGLLVGNVSERADATVPLGDVIEQNPPAATKVAKGTAVDLVVSTGTPSPSVSPTVTPTSTPSTVAVPPVVGMLQTDAEQTLTDAGFAVIVQKKNHPGTDSGYVYDQKPGEGSMLAPGTTVVIKVAI